jgi:drug/metabolite transporter (DMT)-like permease
LSKRTLAILAAIGATTIYALNHTIAKGIMPDYVKPYGLVMLRVIGASALFWLISFLGPKENIAKKDFRRILLCALFGMGLNMLFFFKGLSLTTPINSSVIVTLTPIFVLILSVLLIKEKLSLRKVVGIFVGFAGALGLIFFADEIRQDSPNIPLGNFYVILNSLFYGTYLVLAKILIEKYHPFTFMKWMFLLGILICLPFGYGELVEVDWQNLPFEIIWRIAFVILGTTFCTYLFNIFALTQLRASTVSAFVYVQPLMAILFAVAMGKDNLTTVKVLAASLVLLGVYLASRKPKKAAS